MDYDLPVDDVCDAILLGGLPYLVNGADPAPRGVPQSADVQVPVFPTRTKVSWEDDFTSNERMTALEASASNPVALDCDVISDMALQSLKSFRERLHAGASFYHPAPVESARVSDRYTGDFSLGVASLNGGASPRVNRNFSVHPVLHQSPSEIEELLRYSVANPEIAASLKPAPTQQRPPQRFPPCQTPVKVPTPQVRVKPTESPELNEPRTAQPAVSIQQIAANAILAQPATTGSTRVQREEKGLIDLTHSAGGKKVTFGVPNSNSTSGATNNTGISGAGDRPKVVTTKNQGVNVDMTPMQRAALVQTEQQLKQNLSSGTQVMPLVVVSTASQYSASGPSVTTAAVQASNGPYSHQIAETQTINVMELPFDNSITLATTSNSGSPIAHSGSKAGSTATGPSVGVHAPTESGGKGKKLLQGKTAPGHTGSKQHTASLSKYLKLPAGGSADSAGTVGAVVDDAHSAGHGGQSLVPYAAVEALELPWRLAAPDVVTGRIRTDGAGIRFEGPELMIVATAPRAGAPKEPLSSTLEEENLFAVVEQDSSSSQPRSAALSTFGGTSGDYTGAAIMDVIFRGIVHDCISTIVKEEIVPNQLLLPSRAGSTPSSTNHVQVERLVCEAISSELLNPNAPLPPLPPLEPIQKEQYHLPAGPAPLTQTLAQSEDGKVSAQRDSEALERQRMEKLVMELLLTEWKAKLQQPQPNSEGEVHRVPPGVPLAVPLANEPTKDEVQPKSPPSVSTPAATQLPAHPVPAAPEHSESASMVVAPPTTPPSAPLDWHFTRDSTILTLAESTERNQLTQEQWSEWMELVYRLRLLHPWERVAAAGSAQAASQPLSNPAEEKQTLAGAPGVSATATQPSVVGVEEGLQRQFGELARQLQVQFSIREALSQFHLQEEHQRLSLETQESRLREELAADRFRTWVRWSAQQVTSGRGETVAKQQAPSPSTPPAATHAAMPQAIPPNLQLDPASRKVLEWFTNVANAGFPAAEPLYPLIPQQGAAAPVLSPVNVVIEDPERARGPIVYCIDDLLAQDGEGTLTSQTHTSSFDSKGRHRFAEVTLPKQERRRGRDVPNRGLRWDDADDSAEGNHVYGRVQQETRRHADLPPSVESSISSNTHTSTSDSILTSDTATSHCFSQTSDSADPLPPPRDVVDQLFARYQRLKAVEQQKLHTMAVVGRRK